MRAVVYNYKEEKAETIEIKEGADLTGLNIIYVESLRYNDRLWTKELIQRILCVNNNHKAIEEYLRKN